jgi:riboflavin synthase
VSGKNNRDRAKAKRVVQEQLAKERRRRITLWTSLGVVALLIVVGLIGWGVAAGQESDKTAGLTDEGGRVNLEKALRASDRLGGHIVSGHVDGIGSVSFFEPVGESWQLRVVAPPALARFLAYKGSITVNGVSLTVNSVSDIADGAEVSINLIPHTVENTSLGGLKAGSKVNLEIDTVARYVERMLQAGVLVPPASTYSKDTAE